MSATTIRVKTETRDRLLALAAQHLGGGSHDDAIQFLLDLHWQLTCIEQADQLREQQPHAWRQNLRDNEVMDSTWSPTQQGSAA